MDLVVKKSKLNGIVAIPPSKSFSHRHLIMAMLSKQKTLLPLLNDGDDLKATCNVALNLGCTIEQKNGHIILDSTHLLEDNKGVMDVYASGSTLRFLIPICLTHAGSYTFYLRDRLKERSLKVYESLFRQCTFERKNQYLTLSGKIEAGYYEIDGSHSSQFLSGLFLALPLLEEDSEVVIKNEMVSSDYFQMTLACMEAAGIEIEAFNQKHFFIKGKQKYRYAPFMVESDASSAVFIKVAAYLGHSVKCGMTTTHFQKDACIDDYLKQIQLGDCVIDVKDCPDIVPALALAMALTPHHYQIIGASRLKDKESNRLVAVSEVLNQLGANVQMTEDGLEITGVTKLHGGTVDSYQDHRIAMMAVIAGLQCERHVFIKNAECVHKSWPTFYTQIQEVGGELYEL